MGTPVKVGALLSRVRVAATQAVSRTLLSGYKPQVLCPDSHCAADVLREEFLLANQSGLLAMRNLILGIQEAGGRNECTKERTLSAAEAIENVMNVATELQRATSSSDPDGLAAELVRLFCVGVPKMDVLDNRRRVVATWSAILAPSVVMREKSKREITADTIVECALDWVEFGFTDDARDAWAMRDTRFIAAHPARMYHLIADSAQGYSLDHEKLLFSLIKPVLMSIGQYIGTVQATAEHRATMTTTP